MGIGQQIEKRGHIVGFKEEINKSKQISKDSFFVWFDGSSDLNQSFVQGAWDFSLHIAAPVAKWMKQASEKTVLDLGYGGARMLAAASRHFKKAIGVDIHDENSLVTEELKKRGIENIELIKSDGESIPVNDESIDLVYSFIVLQHVEKIEIFKKYFEETYRILKPNGLAVLYFGREYKYSMAKSSRLLYFIDRLYEYFKLRKGYRELPARVNTTNLNVSLGYAQKVAIGCGFKKMKVLVSRKDVPDGVNLYGGQNGLVLKK